MTSSVAGLTTSIVCPAEASRHSLLMRSFLDSIAAVDIQLALSDGNQEIGTVLMRLRASAATKLRLAFLQARRDALFGVFALEQQLLELALDRQPFGETSLARRTGRPV